MVLSLEFMAADLLNNLTCLTKPFLLKNQRDNRKKQQHNHNFLLVVSSQTIFLVHLIKLEMNENKKNISKDLKQNKTKMN